jgi:hypothetical protein
LRESSEVKALLAKYRAARDELYRLAATLHAASEALSTSSSTNSSL